MIEWSEQHQAIRDMVRRFVEAEIKPRLTEFEHGDTPPHDVLRKMTQTFGIDELGGGDAAQRPATAGQLSSQY